jgi:hypothetical protein
MKTIQLLTGTLLLCFLSSGSLCQAQTKNAATDIHRQENLDKLQKKRDKQRAAYNKMTEEQKAVARAKALERKTGKPAGGVTGSKPGLGTANKQKTTVKSGASQNVKPIPAPNTSKPNPAVNTSNDPNKKREPAPAVKSSLDKKADVAKKSVILKPAIRTRASVAEKTKESGKTKTK